MKIPSIVVFILLIIFYLIVPIAIMFAVRDDKKFKTILTISLLLFFVALLVGVLGKLDITSQFISINFDFSGSWLNKSISTKLKTTNLDKIINMLMLMPLGSAVCMISKRKNIKFGFILSLVIGLFCGLIIEMLQFVLPVFRSVQLLDVIYNTISSCIGYLYISVIYYFVKLCKFIKQSKN